MKPMAGGRHLLSLAIIFLCIVMLALNGCGKNETKESAGTYIQANTDWLAACRYGIGVHWTAQTVPLSGDALPFNEAVEKFDLNSFVTSVEETGADYVLFTITHALQMLPAPHPVIDRILPGRTATRDLIGEMGVKLAERKIPLILYYNHSCNHDHDAEWEDAVGYNDADKTKFAENLIEIIGYMGKKYGSLIKAWWFDSPYSLDPRGPHNSVTTDLAGFQFPWERFTVAAKEGYPERLVTYNAGIMYTFAYTKHQDYWSGEMTQLKDPPESRTLPDGRQNFVWLCLDDRGWVHAKPNSEIKEVLYSDDAVLEFVRQCNSVQVPVTFNIGIYQDGTLSKPAIRQMLYLKDNL